MNSEGHRRHLHRRNASTDTDNSYVYEVVEDDEAHDENITTAKHVHMKSALLSRNSSSNQVNSSDSKVRVMFRTSQGDTGAELYRSESHDEYEVVEEVEEEEEVEEDDDDGSTDTADDDEEAEVIEVFEEVEVVEDDDDDDSDQNEVRMKLMQTNLTIVSIGEDEVLEEEEVEDDQQESPVGTEDDDDLEEETLGDDDLEVLDEEGAEKGDGDKSSKEEPHPDEDDDDDDDDGVTKDELAECIEYVLRQKKAVANFILTEDQADVMMNLPRKIMKLIVDHLEVCDNTGDQIDWDFLLKIVLPFCDKAQIGDEADDDHDDNKAKPASCITCDDGIFLPPNPGMESTATTISNLPDYYRGDTLLETFEEDDESDDDDETEDDDRGIGHTSGHHSEVTYESEYELKGVKNVECDSSISETSKHDENDEDDESD